MPKLPLEVDQPSASRQDALRRLNDHLPEFMHVMSNHGQVWVSYEDRLPLENALDAVTKALDDSRAREHGISIGQP